jgi:hypothetical protein
MKFFWNCKVSFALGMQSVRIQNRNAFETPLIQKKMISSDNIEERIEK